MQQVQEMMGDGKREGEKACQERGGLVGEMEGWMTVEWREKRMLHCFHLTAE